ncbi:MAG: response regulator transcription factor [Acidobacteriaceae bacterium]|nr:response regulator transcription factor [Acidobacteriaceae bacterium]
MTIKTVVADDEPLARDRIRRLIEADRDLEIVQECRNGTEVLNTLLSREVDLLLLDIHMPGLTGLDVVREMGTRKLPMIVFITAHDQYAISAFEVNAVDYLLKPIESVRFHEALRRVKERKQKNLSLTTDEKFASVLSALESVAGSAHSSYVPRFLVHSGSKDMFVPVDEIAWVEAADYYVCLHVAGKKHLLRESIKKLEGELDPKKFIRIHRSAIVSIDCVREIHREGRSEGWVLLSNGDRVRMSVNGWQKLLAAGCRR